MTGSDVLLREPGLEETLARIADLVGCSVEALNEGCGRPDLRDILELLSLWPTLDAATRARIMAYARAARAS